MWGDGTADRRRPHCLLKRLLKILVMHHACAGPQTIHPVIILPPRQRAGQPPVHLAQTELLVEGHLAWPDRRHPAWRTQVPQKLHDWIWPPVRPPQPGAMSGSSLPTRPALPFRAQAPSTVMGHGLQGITSGSPGLPWPLCRFSRLRTLKPFPFRIVHRPGRKRSRETQTEALPPMPLSGPRIGNGSLANRRLSGSWSGKGCQTVFDG